MKRISYLLSIVLVASIVFLPSCQKDPVTSAPTILFNATPGFTTTDVSVTAGSVIKIGIIANGTSSNLSRITISQLVGAQSTTLHDSTFSSAQFSQNFTIATASVAGSVKLTFKISQEDGETAELSLTITTTVATGGAISVYSAKILGSSENLTVGSSFASSNGQVYDLASAKTNSALIDWMYYYNTTNLATIASPKDATVASVFTSATNGPATWATRNDTRFQVVTLPTGVTWDNITTDTQIIPLASGASSTKISSLTVGKIISFYRADGKMGLIKVDAITGTTAGTITYSVKVQQ
jgi:hypothetical protein